MNLDYNSLQEAVDRRAEESSKAFNNWLQKEVEEDHKQGMEVYVDLAVMQHKENEQKQQQMEQEAEAAAEKARAAVKERYAKENRQIMNNQPYYKALREVARNIVKD